MVQCKVRQKLFHTNDARPKAIISLKPTSQTTNTIFYLRCVGYSSAMSRLLSFHAGVDMALNRHRTMTTNTGVVTTYKRKAEQVEAKRLNARIRGREGGRVREERERKVGGRGREERGRGNRGGGREERGKGRRKG